MKTQRVIKREQRLDPQTLAMNQANESARLVGAEAAERHQQALEQAAQHRQNVVKVMISPNTANLSQGQINALVRATPAALVKALREIAK